MKLVLFIVGYFIIWMVCAIIIRKLTYDEISWDAEDAVLCGLIWPIWIPVIIIMIPFVFVLFVVDFFCDKREDIEEETEEEL